MPLIALALIILLAVIALIPLSIIGRFRMATMRRPARGWMITINVIGLAVSVGMFLFSAMIVSRWVPDALPYTLAGVTVGSLLGFLATKLIRWESVRGRLYYTPNKWLGLSVTLLVTVRLLFGFWRSFRAWQSAISHTEWVASSGVAGSMAAGAVALGYYLIFWAGVRGHLRANSRAAIRAD